jgi:ribonuclease HII
MRNPYIARNGSRRAEPSRTVQRPLGYTPRSGSGLLAYERVLARAGFAPVAGIDEAGRGACAGPLVVAAAVLPVDGAGSRFRTGQLADSKALTPAVRSRVYDDILRRALSWHVVVIPPRDIDRLGLHVCNVTGMRRAVAGLACRPGYVLTDGFPVSGMPAPGLAVWKGDQVAACVAAASVLAKVTRDRIMTDLHERYPEYEFAEHKGYVTERHAQALSEHGPCPEHRFRYANVNEALRALEAGEDTDLALVDDVVADEVMKDVCVPYDAGSVGPAPDHPEPDHTVPENTVLDSGALDG